MAGTLDTTDTHLGKPIVVCGGGLAGHMATVYLANRLDGARRIIFLPNVGSAVSDPLYGSVTAPSAYDFLRALGIDEPVLIQGTSTSFSFGTAYRNWPSTNSDWVQCHHLPLAAINGVPIQHHLTLQEANLQALLVSAVAAAAGKFAHPPQDPRIPLSRAEYGYQFASEDLVRLLAREAGSQDIEVVTSAIADVCTDDGAISSVILETGVRIQGGLFVDCTGSDRRLQNALGPSFDVERSVSVDVAIQGNEVLGPAMRTVTASQSGWTAVTHLQERTHRLDVSDSSRGSAIQLGQVAAPWVGNCVGIGHAACALEPLTPAPMILLQADLERLSELIPVGAGMEIERREYNRRFNDDVSHARLFQNALFNGVEAPKAPYWEDAMKSAQSEALDRKIAQFEHRGLLVKYDLEPFNDEDWLILHQGMGRRPRYFDRLAERASIRDVRQQFSSSQQAIQQIVSRMPPHHTYVANLKRYLEKQQNG